MTTTMQAERGTEIAGTATWRPLLLDCGAISALTVLARGVLVGDREAIAIGLALAGVTVLRYLLRGMWARMATMALGGLLLNDVVWMSAAVYALLTNGGSSAAALAPIVLVIAGCLGVIAAIGSLLRRREGAAKAVATTGVVAAVLLVATSVLTAGSEVRVQTGDLTITARDMAFSRSTLSANPGRVSIVASNDDLFWHTFTIDELDIDLRLPTGGRRRVTFTAPPGRYEFVCAIPGHEGAGMRGILVVR